MKNSILIIILLLVSVFIFNGAAYADDVVKLEEGSEGYVLLSDADFYLSLKNITEESKWLIENSDKKIIAFDGNEFVEKIDKARFLIKATGMASIACINNNSYYKFNLTVLDKVESIQIESDIKYPKVGDTVTYTVVGDDKRGFLNAIWYMDGEEIYKGSQFVYTFKDGSAKRLTVNVGNLTGEDIIREKNSIFSFIENSAYGRLIAIGILFAVALCVLLIRKKKPDLYKFSDDGFKKIYDSFCSLTLEIDKENNQKRIYRLFSVIDFNLSNLTNLLLKEDEIKINEFDNLTKEMQRKQNVISTAKRRYKKLDKEMLKRFFANNIKDFEKIKENYDSFYLTQKKNNREKYINRKNKESIKSVFSGFDLKYRESDKCFYEEFKAAAKDTSEEKRGGK